MDETGANIRKHQLGTLSFFASIDEQREFATKVFYPCYQAEFSCWWHDMFYPDEPFSLEMYSSTELAILKRFSETLDKRLDELGLEEMSIEHLQTTSAWMSIVSAALVACADLQRAN